MICPDCKKENKKSRLSLGPASTTCMAFSTWYDEDGVYHNHDMNIVMQTYSCSNGHSGMMQIPNTCPGCDWNQ